MAYLIISGILDLTHYWKKCQVRRLRIIYVNFKEGCQRHSRSQERMPGVIINVIISGEKSRTMALFLSCTLYFEIRGLWLISESNSC